MTGVIQSNPHAKSAGNSSRLELPGRLLRSTSAVLAVGFALALALGIGRSDADVAAEMHSAMGAVRAVTQVQGLRATEDEVVIETLRAALAAVPLRHLRISLRDENGMALLGAGERRSGLSSLPGLDALVALQRQWQAQADPPPVVVEVERPGRPPWTLIVTPDPDSERRESIIALIQSAAVLAGAALLMMAVLQVQIRRGLAPMSALLQTIAQLRGQDRSTAFGGSGAPAGTGTATGPGAAAADARRSAPTARPVRELQAIASALQDLGADLAQTERQRRVLSLRLQSLQEDERRRMAQELHDELGQRLTALRIGIRVLQRRLEGHPEAAAAVAELGLQVQAAQLEVSDLLRRLAPRADQVQPVRRLIEMLEDLTAPLAAASPDAGAAGAPEALQVILELEVGQAPLSEALMMALYRMSQEALTNVRRHAAARCVRLQIRREGQSWDWSCEDDGRGLRESEVAMARGNGLAGLRERAWAFGGDLHCSSSPGGGLRLEAKLSDGPESLGAAADLDVAMGAGPSGTS